MATVNVSGVTLDTLITIKLQHGTEHKRIKLPLRDLTAAALPGHLRKALSVDTNSDIRFSRYSDSAGKFVELDEKDASVYKQLYRAAKAKLKLRILAEKVDLLGDAVPERSQDSLISPIDPNQLSLAGLQLGEAPQQQPMVNVEPTIEHLRSTQDALGRQLSGLNSYLNDFGSNMAQEYAAAFGSQIPAFLETAAAPPEAAAVPSVSVDTKPKYATPPFGAFSVCCNKCKFAIPDHHWHCSTCQEGDFDLCQQCLDAGNHCDDPEHYLIKRVLEDGKIISSQSQTITMKPTNTKIVQEEAVKEVPGAFSHPHEEFTGFAQSSRTCNCCISIYDDSQFVTCKDCDDYDLCIACHLKGDHGHHPGHAFTPAIDDMVLEDCAAAACEPGRNQPHDAICDGCDLKIVGVRHKCLACPDWDYCMTCFKSAEFIHPGHRFAPIYEPLGLGHKPNRAVHYGVKCDGPLCDGKRWIVGDRYKCAVCDDLDFCANCEALPTSTHNATHPLIKFRTPVRNVNVTTLNEPGNGLATQTLGDRQPQTNSRGTETMPPVSSANASTQAEREDDVTLSSRSESTKQATVTDEAAEPEPIAKLSPIIPDYDAYFVRDYVHDGTEVLSGEEIYQTWTLYNPSSVAWPVGCALRWAGGDHMIDVDTTGPGSIAAFEKATTSNATVSEVPRNSEYSFSVKLRAPEKLGRAVSYWRLYSPDGRPFGNRMWCDVVVIEKQPEREELPLCSKVETEIDKADSHVTEEPEEAGKDISESQMVFPKLEKESPASSTHFESVPSVAPTSPVIAEEAEEILSHYDVESVTVDLEDDETDDGFLTDEDYDMVEDANAQH